MKYGKLLLLGLGAAGLGGLCGAWSGGAQSVRPARPAPDFTLKAPGAMPASPLDLVRNLLTDSSPASLTKLARLLPQLSVGEIWSLLETLNASSPARDGVAALTAGHLADRLVELDPERALQAVRKFPGLEHPLAAALGRAAAVSGDPARCREWAGRILDDEARGGFWKALGGTAGAPLADVVLESGQDAIGAWTAQFAARDLKACQAWAVDHPDAWFAAAAAAADAGDPRQALEWVRALPENPAKAGAGSGVYAAWMAKDPAAALAAFGADESPQQIRGALYDMGKEMAAQAPETIIAAIAAQPDAAYMKFGQIGSLAGRWLREWVARDPQETVSTLFALPDSPLRHDLIAKATLYWNWNSTPDLRARLETAVGNEPPGETREAVFTALARGSAVTGDADSAFRFLDQQQQASGSNGRNELCDQAAADLIASAPAALAEHWAELPEEVRSARRHDLLESWRQLDPSAAQAWDRQHPGP
jgi:hypothetical protein